MKVLSIDLPIDYGYNGCSGFMPENCDRSVRTTIINLDRRSMTAEFMPGIVIPLEPFFGSMGVAPAPALGRVSSNPPGRHAGNLDNKELVAWPRAETATDFISMATDPDLKVATTLAIQEMIDFLVAHKGLTKHQAYQLVSIAGDVAITQLVDRPVVGVHVKMPKSIFQR